MLILLIYREKMKIPANVVDQLIQGAQSDIRLVLNMLSTWKLSHDSMDFDEGKKMYVLPRSLRYGDVSALFSLRYLCVVFSTMLMKLCFQGQTEREVRHHVAVRCHQQGVGAVPLLTDGEGDAG